MGSSGSTYEKLTPYDTVGLYGDHEDIRPGEEMVFDVSDLAPNYTIFANFGYWDYVCYELGGGSCAWEKHHTAVMCCDNVNLCWKYGAFDYSAHNSGERIIYLSSLFPAYSWPGHSSCPVY